MSATKGDPVPMTPAERLDWLRRDLSYKAPEQSVERMTYGEMRALMDDELAALRARHARALELLREVHTSGRDEGHPSINYHEVQIDCDTLEEISAFLASEPTP